MKEARDLCGKAGAVPRFIKIVAHLRQLRVGNISGAAILQQSVDHLRVKFRVRLHRKNPVAVDQRGIGAKVIGAHHGRVRGAGDNLILMPRVQREFFTVQLVGLPPDSPAAIKLGDFATQRLCDDLVTKADPLAGYLAKVGLRFDLPEPEQPQTPGAPGMDPTKPPKLR